MFFLNERQRQMYNYRKNPIVAPKERQNKPVNKNIKQMMEQFSNPRSTVSSLAGKSVGNISKTLDNVQQVLKVVQSAAPIVEEYGPIVKNIPAMYKMMKALGSVESIEEDKENTEPLLLEERPVEVKGISTPKLFF